MDLQRQQEVQAERTKPTITLVTGSSMLGLGCIVGNESIKQRGRMEEKEQHIQVLEIKAIRLSQKAVTDKLYDQHVRVRSDSTTAVSYVNKMGRLNIWNVTKYPKKYGNTVFIGKHMGQTQHPYACISDKP